MGHQNFSAPAAPANVSILASTMVKASQTFWPPRRGGGRSGPALGRTPCPQASSLLPQRQSPPPCSPTPTPCSPPLPLHMYPRSSVPDTAATGERLTTNCHQLTPAAVGEAPPCSPQSCTLACRLRDGRRIMAAPIGLSPPNGLSRPDLPCPPLPFSWEVVPTEPQDCPGFAAPCRAHAEEGHGPHPWATRLWAGTPKPAVG